jgi:sulfatase maturation enzyme AslB (radical SAM superfamily)
MRNTLCNTWTIAILAVLLAAGIFLTTAAAQKASVPRTQDRLTMGEEPTKQLLLVMSTNGRDTVTKQEYMKFAEQEFDRLDKEKKGTLNVHQFSQMSLASSHYAGK